MPMNSTRLERSVPKRGYWRVLVVAMRAPETSRAQAKAAFEPGRGEGRVRVAVLQVVALDRVADRDREHDDHDQRPRRAQRATAPHPLIVRRPLEAPIADDRRRRRPGAESGRAERRTVGQQGQAEDQGRGQVAEAGLEAARHAVRAGGRGRGDSQASAAARPTRPASADDPPRSPRLVAVLAAKARGARARRRPARAAAPSSGQKIQRPWWRPGRNQSDQTEPSVR